MTGTFIELFIILMIVLIHELGHFIAATYYNWRIQSITLWMFGGVMKTDEHGVRHVKEELIVTMAGPLQHVFIFFIVILLSGFHILPESIVQIIIYYNTVIFLFNLLPIWPLDGGKLFFLCLALYFPYQKAYEWSILHSLVFCILLALSLLILTPFMLSSTLILLFLILENYGEWKQRYYVFIRFLFNRYRQPVNYAKTSPIYTSKNASLFDVFQKFQQGKQHKVYIKCLHNKPAILNEIDCLYFYFEKNYYTKRMGELFYKNQQ